VKLAILRQGTGRIPLGLIDDLWVGTIRSTRPVVAFVGQRRAAVADSVPPPEAIGASPGFTPTLLNEGQH
jgi:hypothetical protein